MQAGNKLPQCTANRIFTDGVSWSATTALEMAFLFPLSFIILGNLASPALATTSSELFIVTTNISTESWAGDKGSTAAHIRHYPIPKERFIEF